MKASYCLTALILAASLGAAHAQSAKDAVDAANKRFTDTYANKNAPDLAEFYTKDASVFPPDMARVDGRENIEKMWQGVMDMWITDLTLTANEVEEDGNLAFESGTFTLKAPGEDGKPADATGKYVVVWVKRDDIWKMYRHIWNSDPALALTAPVAASQCLLDILDENNQRIPCAPLGAGDNISDAEINRLIKIGMVDAYVGMKGRDNACDIKGDPHKVFVEAMARYDDGVIPRGGWYEQILLGNRLLGAYADAGTIDDASTCQVLRDTARALGIPTK